MQQDPRFEYVAIDYLDEVKNIAEQTKQVCRDMTHAYYTSYVHVEDFMHLKDKNVPMSIDFSMQSRKLHGVCSVLSFRLVAR